MYFVLLSETYITRIPEDDSEERSITRTLLAFKDDAEADDALVGYYESQDDSYQVKTQKNRIRQNVSKLNLEINLKPQTQPINWFIDSLFSYCPQGSNRSFFYFPQIFPIYLKKYQI